MKFEYRIEISQQIFIEHFKKWNRFIWIYLYITYYIPLEQRWSHGHRFTANTERTPCHGVKATEWRFHSIRKDIDTLRSWQCKYTECQLLFSRSTNNTITEFGHWNYFRSWLCVLDFRSYERVSVASCPLCCHYDIIKLIARTETSNSLFEQKTKKKNLLNLL